MELSVLNGVGEKKVELINSLDIYSVEDLIEYYPSSVTFMNYTDLFAETILVKVKVLTLSKVFYARKNFSYFNIKALHNNQLLTFVVYNQPYLHKKISLNSEISIECRVYKNSFVVSKILFDNAVPYVKVKYRSNSKIKSKQIEKLVSQALLFLNGNVSEKLEEKLRKKYKLLSYKEAIYLIHKPRSDVDYKNAVRTLKYIEAFEFMKYIRKNNVEELSYDFSCFDISKSVNFTNNLDLELTQGQKAVVREMLGDVSKNKRFNLLVHGDVGCGKTMVSIIATSLFVANKSQVAILCPTEVLAKQMYDNYIKHISNGVLLTSSTIKRDLNNIHLGLKEGTIDYVVGTHSLLNDDLSFRNLGLVIIDEQQRFGVLQREKLINKQRNVNTILMSATPIPRTVGLVLFDNIKVIQINDLPRNRSSVFTKFEHTLSNDTIEDLKNTVKRNEQVFVVVPTISENNLNIDSIDSVHKTYLKYFSKKQIGIIHGKLNPKQVMEVMETFKKGDFDILIATSIIEVGIDVSNATRIIIHSASRFGLATLHQLRGRVGRGDKEAICTVINDSLTERLKLFVDCDDGFAITEADYKMRGFGDLKGVQQSGYSMFKLLNVFNDINVLECAKRDVDIYFKNDV